MGSSSATILECLTKVAPLLQKLIEGEIDVTVTSRDKWLAYCPCGEEKLDIKVGEQVPYESVSGKSMREKRLVVNALRRGGWSQTEAARLLGISLRSLRHRIEKLYLKKSRANCCGD